MSGRGEEVPVVSAVAPVAPLADGAAAPMTGAVLAAMMAQTLISAGTHLVARFATSTVSPFLLGALRLTLAGVVWAAVLVALRDRKLPPRAAIPRVVLLGLLAGPVNQGFFLYGLSMSTAAHAALLYALTPVGVYLLAWARGREQGSLWRTLGIVTAFAGVAVLLLGHGLADALGPLWGDVFIMCAVTSWVVFTAESRPFSVEHGALRTSGWSLVAGGLLTLPALPFFATPTAVQAVPSGVWSALAYLVLATSLLAYLLWNYALARADASRVAVFANLQPVATALGAWALLGEKPGWELLVGGVLVLVGVRLTQRK